MIDFMAGPGNDWFVDDVYLDADWVEEEKKFYELMDEHGWIEEGASQDPRFEVVAPPS